MRIIIAASRTAHADDSNTHFLQSIDLSDTRKLAARIRVKKQLIIIHDTCLLENSQANFWIHSGQPHEQCVA